jgi:iron-sulfur cluster assembly accessory protein
MIQLSDAATSEVLRLRSRRKQPNLQLRLGIQLSGCLGMSYTLSFESFDSNLAQPADCLWTTNGIQIVVRSEDLHYLDGLVIDYSEDLMGGGFRFHNPNTVQTCGCGASFSTQQSSS